MFFDHMISERVARFVNGDRAFTVCRPPYNTFNAGRHSRRAYAAHCQGSFGWVVFYAGGHRSRLMPGGINDGHTQRVS